MDSGEFDLFEAVCGVQGDHGFVCGADAPMFARRLDRLVDPLAELDCTRKPDHTGEHVAAHTDGRELARWITWTCATCGEIHEGTSQQAKQRSCFKAAGKTTQPTRVGR